MHPPRRPAPASSLRCNSCRRPPSCRSRHRRRWGACRRSLRRSARPGASAGTLLTQLITTRTRTRTRTLTLTITLTLALTLTRLRAETITLDEEQQHSADQAHMANMIKMLRQFDAPPPPPRKPPPNTDLTLVELAELRARMVAAMGEACASGRGQPGQPAAAVARVRVTSLARHQLGRFLMLLAPR